MGMTDLQKAQATIQDGATYLSGLAGKLEQLDNGTVLREVLPKAMEGQPDAFSFVCDAIGDKDFGGDIAGFLASPLGAELEQGTRENLLSTALQITPAVRFAFKQLAQLHRDAVAQLRAKGKLPAGEQGEQQGGGA